VIQVAGAFGIQAGVVAADSAMHRQLVVVCGLKAEVERAGRMHGLGTARVAARRSRTGAESPGESLLRLVAEDLGYDVELQFPVAGPDGVPFAYADLRLTGTRSLLEFDGAIKYEGACGRQALVAEKEREDRIRRLGWGLERVIWSDLAACRTQHAHRRGCAPHRVNRASRQQAAGSRQQAARLARR